MWLSKLGARLVSMKIQVQSLASLSGLRIQHGHKLRCRSQTQLTSGVAVAMVWAGSCRSDFTLIFPWELSYAVGAVVKRKKEKRKERNVAVYPNT